jgi:hypothetical protein
LSVQIDGPAPGEAQFAPITSNANATPKPSTTNILLFIFFLLSFAFLVYLRTI